MKEKIEKFPNNEIRIRGLKLIKLNLNMSVGYRRIS